MNIKDITKYLNKPLELKFRNNARKETIKAPQYNPKHLEQTRNSLPFTEMHL